ncbi:Porphobilinogen deaminase [Vulgatibacter incomptus]|uniref:Porphobilinogen deaminase n=1 Tax=Vulgatibacter incomptus TaxID=1391653 RepID=A0A0K1PCD2_9BACT|nr:Porphobilinogen deaminase [Vulgatibacter incomptus]
MKPLVIATRRSALALWQAEHIAERLKTLTGRSVELLPLVTTGDRILDVPLARVGGKGLFVKEIEEALLDGRADLAVHSLKDVPTVFPPGLALGAVTEREDPRDALCSPRWRTLDALPKGARLGTSSLRRQCQLKAVRPDLEIVNVRGNVQTRLSKADAEVDAVVLAYAGLRRLGLADAATEVLDAKRSIPAIGQGALAIEIRDGDPELGSIVAKLDHAPTRAATDAERALLARLEGGCQVPIAGHATVEGGVLTLRALVGRPDGTGLLHAERRGDPANAAEIGEMVAGVLLAMGARKILDELAGATVGVPH